MILGGGGSQTGFSVGGLQKACLETAGREESRVAIQQLE